MKEKAIIVDLDGTLFNTTHREHFLQGEKKDWDSFYAWMIDDPVNEWCRQLVRAFYYTDHDLHHVIYLTGRPEKYRDLTVTSLTKNNADWHDLLLMRPDGDFRKDSIVKPELYEKHIKENYDVSFCVEDRKQVVDAWRALWLTCLQCAPGEF